LALSAVLAALLATLYAALARVHNWSEVGLVMFLTVAVCWTVLIPAKFWDGRNGDSWLRRVVMMVLGTGVGCVALWLKGLGPTLPNLFDPNVDEAIVQNTGVGRTTPIMTRSNPSNPANINVVAGYLSYFALALCVLRWWKMADRNRSHRFSCF